MAKWLNGCGKVGVVFRLTSHVLSLKSWVLGLGSWVLALESWVEHSCKLFFHFSNN